MPDTGLHAPYHKKLKHTLHPDIDLDVTPLDDQLQVEEVQRRHSCSEL